MNGQVIFEGVKWIASTTIGGKVKAEVGKLCVEHFVTTELSSGMTVKLAKVGTKVLPTASGLAAYCATDTLMAKGKVAFDNRVKPKLVTKMTEFKKMREEVPEETEEVIEG